MISEYDFLYYRIGMLSSQPIEDWFQKEEPRSVQQIREDIFSQQPIEMLNTFVGLFFYNEIQVDGLTYLMGENVEAVDGIIVFNEKPSSLMSKIMCYTGFYRPGVKRLDSISMIFRGDIQAQKTDLIAFRCQIDERIWYCSHKLSDTCTGRIVVQQLPHCTILNFSYLR